MIDDTFVEDTANRIAADTIGQMEDKVKKIELLASEFKTINKDLLAEIEEMDAKKKALEAKMKESFKNWSQMSSFVELRDSLQEQLQGSKETEKMLNGIVSTIKVELRSSKQPSYATGFSIALSLLNQITGDKYAKLPELCKKQVAAIKTGVDVLDKDLSDFSPELKELAKQRGVKISSINFQADMKSFLTEVGQKIGQWFSKSIAFFRKLLPSVKQNTESIQDFNKLLAKAQ